MDGAGSTYSTCVQIQNYYRLQGNGGNLNYEEASGGDVTTELVAPTTNIFVFFYSKERRVTMHNPLSVSMDAAMLQRLLHVIVELGYLKRVLVKYNLNVIVYIYILMVPLPSGDCKTVSDMQCFRNMFQQFLQW